MAARRRCMAFLPSSLMSAYRTRKAANRGRGDFGRFPFLDNSSDRKLLGRLPSVQCKISANGSISTEMGCPRDVCFAPDSDHWADMLGGPVRARKRHSEWVDLGYSITSSAR